MNIETRRMEEGGGEEEEEELYKADGWKRN